MIRKVLIPGSFDPVTNGHMDIIRRASEDFEEVLVAVMVNDDKKEMFPLEERADMLELACRNLLNVRVIAYPGMTVDLYEKENIDAIVKGIRNGKDLNWESKIHRFLISQNPLIRTIWMPADPLCQTISSTEARELLEKGDWKALEELIPEPVWNYLSEK